MIAFTTRSARPRWVAILLLLACSLVRAHGASLPTTERDITSYARGPRTYICLLIDNGVVPLVPPYDATVEANVDVKVVWTRTGSSATFRPASSAEAALLDMMDRPEAAAEWQKYLASTARDVAPQPTLHDLQPNILAVNHWRMGAVTLDYTLGGMKYGWLLLLWRCADGKTIEVTLRCDYTYFQPQVEQLYSMIGGAMLMQK